MNQIFILQDSTPYFDTVSQSVPQSFHLNQFDEFEYEKHVEEEQDDEVVHEL